MKHTNYRKGLLCILLLLVLICTVGMAEASESDVTIELLTGKVYLNESFLVAIHAPGATLVRLYNAEDDSAITDVTPNDYGNTSCWLTASGDTRLYARACYDAIVEGNTPVFKTTSNTLDVRPEPNGQGSKADVSVSEEIARGTVLPVDITLNGDDDRFYVHLLSVVNDVPDTDNILYSCGYSIAGSGNNTFTAYVPTGFLTAGGSYCIIVQSRGYGETWGQSDWTDAVFTVTEDTPQVSISVSPSTVLINHDVTVVASVPGTSHAYLVWDGDTNNIKNSWYSGFGAVVETVSFGGTGKHTATLYIYNDESEQYEAWPEKIEVYVTSNGYLKATEITAPPMIDAGDALTFSFEAVEHADRYMIAVIDRDTQDEDIVYMKDTLSAGTHTIPAYVFASGCNYRMYVFAYADTAGYSFSNDETDVIVRNTNIEIELGEGEIALNEDFTVTIKAPGAQHVRLYMSAYDGRCWDVSSDMGYDNLTTTLNVDRPTQLYARACYDMSDSGNATYSGISNIIEINPANKGEGTAPTITMDALVDQGKFLPVEITTFNNTTVVDLRVLDGYNKIVFEQQEKVPEDATNLTLYVPTVQLASGKQYSVVVWARGYGQTWKQSESSRFTVKPISGRLENEIIMTPDNPMVWQNVTITASVPDVTDAYFVLPKNSKLSYVDGRAWNKGCVSMTATTNFAGKHAVYLYGTTDGGYTYHKVETIEIEFGCVDTLAMPEFSVPVKLYKDEYLAVDIEPVEHAEQYRYYVIDNTADKIAYSHIAQTNERFIVKPDVFTPGHEYGVYVYVDAPAGHYSTNGAYATMTAVDETIDKPALKLPSSLTTIKEDAFAGTNAERIVVPQSVTSIESGAFAAGTNLECVEFKGDIADIATDAFGDIENLIVICPADSNIAEYAEAHNFITILK